MVRAVLKDEKKVLPVCARTAGEYGIQDLYFGVPAEIGKNGVEKIVTLPLDESEKKALALSAAKVRQGIEEVERLVKL